MIFFVQNANVSHKLFRTQKVNKKTHNIQTTTSISHSIKTFFIWKMEKIENKY